MCPPTCGGPGAATRSHSCGESDATRGSAKGPSCAGTHTVTPACCAGTGRWLYGLGYEAYSFETAPPRALTLADFETAILPALGPWDAKAEAAQARAKAAGLPPALRELLLVHDSAPVPLRLGVVGSGGQGPV